MRILVATAGAVVLACAGLVIAALLVWPRVQLGAAGDALASVHLPGFAGHVAVLHVRAADGTPVPVQLRGGKLWPVGRLDAGERLTVQVTVRRPGWAGWLVGHTSERAFTVETPAAHLRGRWLQVRANAPVTIAFDKPVTRVRFGSGRVRELASPRRTVSIGVVAQGSHRAGAVEVASAARSWERLSPATRVSWFPSRPYPLLLTEPRAGATVSPGRTLTLTFSAPVAAVLGSRRPAVSPSTRGRWRLLDEHTLAFRPLGLGFGLGTDVHVTLPLGVHLAGQPGSKLTRSVDWQVPAGTTLRLQQLLAGLGYLPLDWQPAADPVSSARTQLAAAVAPPAGQFTWRYRHTPPELKALWRAGQWNDITRGAVMLFEHTHGLAVDGLVGPRVWQALLEDAIAGKRRTKGYSYVFVHRNVPQSLNLWHNGRVILSSPGNTGVPAAPTKLGTFPVFEHIPIGTMSGTNPDGSHYHDPGIRWISYFHHGDAIHAFNRASFGTPQSLGCVELPLAAAAKVWPYTPIGTLVTVEN